MGRCEGLQFVTVPASMVREGQGRGVEGVKGGEKRREVNEFL
jgi:hypothetical protein